MTATADIFSALLDLGRPSPLPGAWRQHSSQDQTFFQLDGPAKTIRALRHRGFSSAQLTAAGLIRPVADNVWGFHSALREPFLVVLQPMEAAAPGQLLAGNQLLPTPAPIGISLLQDVRSQRLLDGAEQVMVTETLSQVAIFWRLGIPAIPASGLAEMNMPRLETIDWLLGGGKAYYEQERELDEELDEEDEFDVGPETESDVGPKTEKKQPPKLVLVDWALDQIDVSKRCRTVRAAAKHLQLLKHHLDFSLCEGVWRPSEERIERLKTALRFGTVPQIRDMVLDSIAYETTNLASFDVEPPALPGEPTSYAEAHQRFFESENPTELAQPRQCRQMEQWLQRQLVHPLLTLGQSDANPLSSHQMTLVARLSQLLGGELNRLALKTQSLDPSGRRRPMLNQEDLQPLMQLLAAHERLMREIRNHDQ